MEENLEQITDVKILEKYSKDLDVENRIKVAKNINTPSEILEQLSNDEYEAVAIEICKNPNTQSNVLDKLAKQNKVYLYYILANPNCTKELLEKIFNKHITKYNIQILSNPNCPDELINKTVNGSLRKGKKKELASYVNNEKFLKKISRYEDIAPFVLTNTNSSADLIKDILNRNLSNLDNSIYIGHCCEFFGESVFKNPNITDEIINLVLDNSKNKRIPLEAARNPNTSESTLNKLLQNYFKDSPLDDVLIFNILRNKNTSSKTLEEIHNQTTRYDNHIAKHPNISVELLQDIIDSEKEVYDNSKTAALESMAWHDDATPELLEEIYTGINNILLGIALNPNTSKTTLEQISKETKNEEIINALIKNPNTPQSSKEMLQGEINNIENNKNDIER